MNLWAAFQLASGAFLVIGITVVIISQVRKDLGLLEKIRAS
jgi:hypothetical protein